jgi:hypothetical protein
LCAFGLGSTAGAANRAGEFSYDIFLDGDTLSCWIDLTPVLNQDRMEDLLSGLSILIAVDARLENPRRFFFARTVSQRHTAVLITHQLTADRYGIQIKDDRLTVRQFENQMQIRSFISDSIIFHISPVEILNRKEKYRISLSVTSKSYSERELRDMFQSDSGRAALPPTGEKEPFESLFSSFIDLIGFGKISYQIISPPFTLDELPPNGY